ncbi:MAG: T9SS type A sorting domain-containing protein [Sporocytophaga sp.]|uniref:T9SS type A sorting domain-containing protein n=1 Tax=Sporocytophaga sp. TaxID=2231183 RepID=UPI001B0C57C8|nr:T9SS type A sorting domain-containing protein [Sporocytophaga sp.]MBO9698559.1 T9SS type A sorting domain-containing protein [Sporocytophaga sp.]
MKKLFITILYILSITQAYCQLGKLDSTFHSYGYSVFRIKAAKEVSGGKILLGTERGLRRLNADGTVDNTFINAFQLSSGLNAIAFQSDGKILISGYFNNWDGSNFGNFARLNEDGSLDKSFKGDLNATSILSINIRQDGKILICGYFSEYNSSSNTGIALLNSDGTLDASFKSPLTGRSYSINDCAVQSDNKIIISGNLNFADGSTKELVRLNADGSIDGNFITGSGSNDDISKLLILSSGKIIIAGEFTEYNGQAINNYARLNTDGSLDNGFNPGSGSWNSHFSNIFVSSLKELSNGIIIVSCYSPTYNGKNTTGLFQIKPDGEFDKNISSISSISVDGIEVLKNGKILVYGSFKTVNDKPRNKIFLLNKDYSLDLDFNPGDGADGQVSDFILLPNGKIVMVGTFTAVNQERSCGIARLLSNGSLDPTFETGIGFTGNGDNHPMAIAKQDDGKFIVVGNFNHFNDNAVGNIVRLLPDGSIDKNFKTWVGSNNIIGGVKVRPDGKIIITGLFYSSDGKFVHNIMRLNSDGSLDEEFYTGKGTDGPIYDFEIMPDNKLLVVGSFTNYDDSPANHILLLNNEGSIDSAFIIGSGADNRINSIALDKDKIYLGGNFGSFNGYSTGGIVRLDKEGNVDNEFLFQNIWGSMDVGDIIIQSNGQIILTKPFIRLNYDGSIDKDFNISIGDDIFKLGIQPDGKFIIGGSLQYYNGTMIGNICRIDGGDITIPSGIFSTKEFQTFSSVYPNPTTDNLNFTVNGTSGKYNLSIYSVTGNEMLNTEVPPGKFVINTDAFPTGIYVYKVSNRNGEYNIGRIIIDK